MLVLENYDEFNSRFFSPILKKKRKEKEQIEESQREREGRQEEIRTYMSTCSAHGHRVVRDRSGWELGGTGNGGERGTICNTLNNVF